MNTVVGTIRVPYLEEWNLRERDRLRKIVIN